MEILFIILVFFVIGTLALYAINVAKNVAHVLFVVVVGWAAWHYVGPYVVGPGQSASETVIALNDAYKQQAQKNVSTLRDKNFGQEFTTAIERDINQLWDSANQGTGINAWVPEGEKGQFAALKKHASAPSKTLYEYLGNFVKQFFRDVFAGMSAEE